MCREVFPLFYVFPFATAAAAMERAATAVVTTTAATARAAARAAARVFSTAASGTLEAERQKRDQEDASTYLSVFEGIYEMQQRMLRKKGHEAVFLPCAFPFSSPCPAVPAENPSSSPHLRTGRAASAAAVAAAPGHQGSAVDVEASLKTQDSPAPAAIGTPCAAAANCDSHAAELGNSGFIEIEAARRGRAPLGRRTVAGGEGGEASVEPVELQDVPRTQQQQQMQAQQRTKRACVGEHQEEEEKRCSSTCQQYISKHVVVCALADLARSGVRTPQAWQPLLLLVLQELPRFSARQLQQTATALQRGGCCCPLVLQGLTEAFYWRCEEKKPDVQDCVLLLDALRRLRYRPSLRHVNKVIERIRHGRQKLTVSLCLKLLRFFVETAIDATQLKYPSFYWGTLTHVERSIASLHPSEIVAFARLLPRLRIRDGQVYERLCLHLYNRSRDMINSNVRTAGCMQEALLLPGEASPSLPEIAAGEQRRRADVSLAETSGRSQRLMPDAAPSLSQQHSTQEGQPLVEQHDPERLSVITQEAAFLPALLHLGRALVQAKVLELPTPFWLLAKSLPVP